MFNEQMLFYSPCSLQCTIKMYSTYLCRLEYFSGWDLLAQVCQSSQQVVFVLLGQLQHGFVTHDILDHNHPLKNKRTMIK